MSDKLKLAPIFVDTKFVEKMRERKRAQGVSLRHQAEQAITAYFAAEAKA